MVCTDPNMAFYVIIQLHMTAVVCAAVGRPNTELKDDMMPALFYPVTMSVQCEDGYGISASAKSYEATCTSDASWAFTGNCRGKFKKKQDRPPLFDNLDY